MIKTTLPVIVLRNIILFPNSEIRLELDSNTDKAILSLAESCYDKQILIVHQVDILEKNIEINDLPSVGVVGYIEMKIDLPNKKTRVVIRGIKRVLISDYKQEEDNLVTASTEDEEVEELDSIEEMAYVRSLKKQIEYYINNNPNMSNSILSTINGINDLNKLTDIITLAIPGTYERKMEYISEVSPTSRTIMLIEDINQELKIVVLEKSIEDKVSKNLDKSQKDYILQEKLKVIKDELGLNVDKDEEILNLKKQITNLKCPKHIKDRLNLEIRKYENTPITSPEVSIIRNYIDLIIKLPWNFTNDNKDLKKARSVLDETHYGLDDVKTRIIEYLATNQASKNNEASIICLVGPPGVGKTSLAKSISNAMKKNYTKISVGGVNDEAEILGHRRTYIGAAPGRIINGLKKSGSINPVFVIDEIDKMCKDIKGDPASSLLEVLDKEQNYAFLDNYVDEPIDLSQVMFICTANYVDNIPLELKDRLEIINISSYTELEKLHIAKDYIVKKSIDKYKIDKNKIKFSDKALLKIIRNYTKEAGVRELERQINDIIRKVITDMVVNKTDKNYVIGEKEVVYYLKSEKYLLNNTNYKSTIGIVNAMSYTSFGGDILPLEVNIYKGKGDIITTGLLGDVFNESIKTSLGYIKSTCNSLKIAYSLLLDNDIHLHVPEAAIKKDGPSAGVAITTALISALKNISIPKNIAMTGEITLRGNVLAIGGLKEKVIGVKKYGVNKIFIPKENERDLKELDEEITKDIEFILVDNYDEIIKELKL